MTSKAQEQEGPDTYRTEGQRAKAGGRVVEDQGTLAGSGAKFHRCGGRACAGQGHVQITRLRKSICFNHGVLWPEQYKELGGQRCHSSELGISGCSFRGCLLFLLDLTKEEAGGLGRAQMPLHSPWRGPR